MREFNTQMDGTTKINELAKKHIFLDGVAKRVLDILFKFPKLIEVVAGIIKIAKSIEADEPEKKSDGASHQGLKGKQFPRQMMLMP